MDVENLRFAVPTRSNASSRMVALIWRSRYFVEQPPLASATSFWTGGCVRGELAAAIEIRPNFGRDIARGTPAQTAFADGAMPSRAETV